MHVRPKVLSSRRSSVPGKGTDSTRLTGSLILESGRQGWMEPCWLLTQLPDSARDVCGNMAKLWIVGTCSEYNNFLIVTAWKLARFVTVKTNVNFVQYSFAMFNLTQLVS